MLVEHLLKTELLTQMALVVASYNQIEISKYQPTVSREIEVLLEGIVSLSLKELQVHRV